MYPMRPRNGCRASGGPSFSLGLEKNAKIDFFTASQPGGYRGNISLIMNRLQGREAYLGDCEKGRWRSPGTVGVRQWPITNPDRKGGDVKSNGQIDF